VVGKQYRKESGKGYLKGYQAKRGEKNSSQENPRLFFGYDIIFFHHVTEQ